MESAASNSLELNDKETEGVKTDQADSAEELTTEVKQSSSEVNRTAGAGDLFCGQRSEALLLFPEEVWKNILDEVEDSEDIQNVLLAFPELDKSFQNRKTSWLFGLVLPHLLTSQLVVELNMWEYWWPSSTELLKLRLVSKRWKKTVEMALENHSDRRPLLPRESNDAGGSSIVAIPDNHLNYYRIRECTLAPSMFRGAEDIFIIRFYRFLEEMGDFQGSPFPSKLVHIHSTNIAFRSTVARTIALLERFGEDVLRLHFENYTSGPIDQSEDGDLEMFRNILSCLTFVPKLRSLIFSGELFSFTDPQANNFYGTPESQNLFPELPNLEKFEWRVRFHQESSWITRMLNTYGKKEGLRKLGIPLNLLLDVDPAFYQALHLTELHILLDSDSDQNNQRLEQVIEAISSHWGIRKFWLSSVDTPFTIRSVKILELIRMLAKFRFESVVLQNLRLVEIEGQTISDALIPITPITVTSLDLEDNFGRAENLSFEFLRELTNLKFLTVHVRKDTFQELLKEKHHCVVNTEESKSLGNILRGYFRKADDPSWEIPENGGIWKEIPSLEMLTVVVQVLVDDSGRLNKYGNLGVKFVKEYGNKVFYGPQPDVD